MKPSRPSDEIQRLDRLRQYAVLDTLPEQALDDLTMLAAHICEAPIAMISLVDEHRQWFKSIVGFPAFEVSRDVSFCGHAILQSDLFIVPDATEDARFADNPLVTGEPHMRFYAGAPLMTSTGEALGTLCVIDRRRRQLTTAQAEGLRVLSRQVMAQLDLRLQVRQLLAREEGAGSTRLAAIVESSDDAIIGKDLQSVITSWNAAAERIFGFAASEMIGSSIMRLIPEDRHAEEARILNQIQRGETVQAFTTRRLTKAGVTIDVSVTASPIRDDAGHIIGVSKIARDVTKQHQIEAARRASDERYRALFDYAPDGILIASPEGIYLDANASMCRLLGYTLDELIGMDARQLVVESELKNIEPALGAINAREAYQREWQFRRKDRTTLIADVLGTQMPDGNILAIFRDMTERKRLERQFLRAQRLESIGTLAGGIAHDLNNVLAPILMSIELMRDVAITPADMKLLDTIEMSAQRGAALVQQVLSFARGVDGERILVNVIHLVRDLLKVMQETFPKSVTVRMTHAKGLWTVVGDPTQIHQVLLNLLVNARDAMPNGGHITVTMENVVLDETYAGMNPDSKPGAYVMLQVEDSGSGIPPEVRDRIFEPFFTTKELGRGTGLGLATTMAIVKSHGGFITLYSEVGVGTRFKVYLPANHEGAAAKVPPVHEAGLPRGSGELILVVDDEEAIREIARHTLERFGYRVLVASNGAEAIALYARNPGIHVVLTDMAMPIMDGPALIVALLSIDATVRIVGSSGLAANGSVAKAMGAGVEYFVPKPYTAEALLKTLRAILSSTR